MMEKYISLRITQQLENLSPRVNLNCAPGQVRRSYHGVSCIEVLRDIFKILISVSYKNINFISVNFNCNRLKHDDFIALFRVFFFFFITPRIDHCIGTQGEYLSTVKII